MTGSATTFGAVPPPTRSAGVSGDEPAAPAAAGGSVVQRRALRSAVPDVDRDDHDGVGAHAQWGDRGGSRVLVLRGPGRHRGTGPDRRGHHRDGHRDGGGFRGGNCDLPRPPGRHDRRRRRPEGLRAVLWLLVAVPLIIGGLLAVSGRRADRAAPWIGVLAGVATLGLAVAVGIARPTADAPLLVGIRLGLGVDALSALMVLTVAVVTLAVLVFAAGEAALRTPR